MVSGMIIIPLAIGALAVVITLSYASFLDILDRRVPFITWGPMLVIGLPAAGVSFLFLAGGATLFTGYLGIVSVVLFLAYLNNRDEEKPFGFFWTVLAIGLQLYSAWYFYSLQGMAVALLSIATVAILTYASVLESRKKENYFAIAWPVLYFIIAALCWFYYAISTPDHLAYAYLGLIAMFCLIFYVFGVLSLFGGADAWALIFITLIIPLFPFEPLAGYPPFAFFPFTVLVNAVIFNLLAPAGLFITNIIRKNRAPWPYLFLGFPVEGTKIQDSYGFVIEEFEEKDGIISRRFLKLREALGSVVRGRKRVYTRDLRIKPGQYEKELTLYKKAGQVWISYGVPFIVPITAGVLSGLFIGDIVTLFLKFAGGI
jgi:preflagellin peptidase FlaK